MAEQLNIIIVPHTHWDREWYQTFQQFRIRLVRTIDKLLDILDRDPNFSHFMLDGQTITLDDYLEVRPEQEERLKKYTGAGRIQVGPWYLQPDEFLVSGESLIRNLQLGLQRAAEFGEPMRVGYVPDCFGHIAQLPQILRGFGIDSAVFWRGVGAEAHKSEFYWTAPDGTSVLVIHLADPIGYSNARDMPLNPDQFVTRVELLAAPLLSKATTNTLLFMNGSDHLEPQDGLPALVEIANERLAHLDPRHEEIIERYGHIERNGKTVQYSAIYVRIGTLPQYIAAVRQHLAHAQEEPLQTLSGEMRSSQHIHLLPSVLSTRMWIKQQNTATEHLLERWVEPLTTWAWKLGAPYPRGLVTLAWKYLLQNHPHDSICGCSIDQVHRENSVRFAQSQQIGENLIAEAMHYVAAALDTHAPVQANSPSSRAQHEAVPIVVFNPAPGPRTEAAQAVVHLPAISRNAVIVDERGEPRPYQVTRRWRQELGGMALSRETIAAAVALQDVEQPGELIRMAESMLASSLGQGESENPYVVTSIHVEEGQQPGVATIEIMITPRGHVTVNEEKLLAAERQILDLLEREDVHTLQVSVFDQARETIEFIASDLPPYGLKTFWMYPRGLHDDVETPFNAPGVSPFTMPVDETGAPARIENEFYRVEANHEDGTLTVTDKLTGAVFSGLNRFVDSGDIGDLYTYCPPEHDQVISKPSEPPRVEVLGTGPVRSIMRISGRWSVPGACSDNRAGRSSAMTICPIASEISLVPGVRRVDIHTIVENTARDHRLRVIFPVPYTVETASAESTFEVRTRPIVAARPEDVSDWAEEPVNSFPQKRFVDVSNGTIGLGVLNRGLPEYEVVDVAVIDRISEGKADANLQPGQKAVALTLLRCVEWLSRGDLSTRRGHAGPMEYTPEAQCLGHHEFDYALVPHSGDWEAEEALVLREAHAFNTPVRVLVTGQHAGHLPSRTTLLDLEPRELVLSAIKRAGVPAGLRDDAGQGVIVRLYNPLSRAVEASIRPGFACSKAFVANLQEEPMEQLFWNGGPENGQETEYLHVGIRSGQILTLLFI